jgi:hypothetical protein
VLPLPRSLDQEVELALGAQAGTLRLNEVLKQGGFSRVRRATETPFNLILEGRTVAAGEQSPLAHSREPLDAHEARSGGTVTQLPRLYRSCGERLRPPRTSAGSAIVSSAGWRRR